MKILVFGLYSGIWPHALLEKQIIKSLNQNSEFEVYDLSCAMSLNGLCKPREYLGLNTFSISKEMHNVCLACTKNTKMISKTVKRVNLLLSDYLSNSDYSQSSEVVRKANVEQLLSYKHKSIDVGQNALYDVIINFKKSVKTFSDLETVFLRDTIQNSILVIEAAEKILQEINPEIVLCTDSEYGVARSFCEVALSRGIQVYRISNTGAVSEKMETRRMYSWNKFGLTDPALFHWQEFNRTLTKLETKRVAKLLASIKKGKSPWTYSAASSNRSPRKEFNIPEDHKIILVVMSSTDEYMASEESGNKFNPNLSTNVFKDQIEWISYLISKISEIPNTTLVIRPHPREYANKREGLNSEQSFRLDVLLSELPDRVVLDHPSRKFPLPNYWKEISLLTTGWSSTALEAVTEGIPAVSYDRSLPLYPNELIISGNSIDAYMKNLNAALDVKVTPDQVSNVMRWLWLSNFGGAIKLKGGVMEIKAISRLKPVRLMFLILQRFTPNLIKRVELKREIDSCESKKLTKLLMERKASLYET
jgi:hypothetical protein